MPPMPLVSIIMPCFNERATLDDAVARVVAAPYPEGVTLEVVIVDDGSTDGSREIADGLAKAHEPVRLVAKAQNRGKGAAVRTGLKAATGEVLLIHDCDMEYDPADHAAVLGPILQGTADVVIGSRFLGTPAAGGAHRVLYFWHYAANRAITIACDMASNLNLTDIECCTKAFTREAGAALVPHLREDGFGIEPEIVIRAAQLRLPTPPSAPAPSRVREHARQMPSDQDASAQPAASGASDSGERAPARGSDERAPLRPARIYEVPVSYAGRTYAEGKKIGWRDGVRALWVIGRCWIGRAS
ncbi:MAG: glycosyltransferase family 2 protein [Planctomycetota bacterium]